MDEQEKQDLLFFLNKELKSHSLSDAKRGVEIADYVIDSTNRLQS